MTAEDAIFILCSECNYDPIDKITGKLKTGIQWRMNLIKKNVPEDKIEDYTKKILSVIEPNYYRKGEFIPLSVFDKMLKPSTEELELKATNIFTEMTRISNLNQYRDFVTDDKRAIAALDRVGGWVELCECRIDALPFIRKDFLKAYVTVNPDHVEHKRFKGIGTTDKCIYIGTEENRFLIEQQDTHKQQIDLTNLLENIKGESNE